MSKPFALIREIDALLPQTQCGLCGHRDGCLPYASSIAQGEHANKCVPGGQPVADAIAALLGRTILTAVSSPWPIQSDSRPQRIKALIREDECIGCTKCISACPVDAIMGSGKLMHSILTDLCTGCELCIAPCPVDCIDLVANQQPLPTARQRQAQQNDLRARYYAHIERDQQQHLQRKGPVLRAEINSTLFAEFSQYLDILPTIQLGAASSHTIPEYDATTRLAMAKLRSNIKKLEKQLSVRADANKQAQLDALRLQLQTFE